jgi:hypothetical protein
MPRPRPLLRTALILALAGGLTSESSCKAKSNPDGKPPPHVGGEERAAPLGIRVLPAPPPISVRVVPLVASARTLR